MNMHDEEAIPGDAIDQAAAWMFRIEGDPADAALRAELAGWLAADPAHEQAWQLARRAWLLSGQVAPAFEAKWSGQAAPWPRRRPGRRWPILQRKRLGAIRRFAAPSIAAALALAMLAPAMSVRLRSDFVTDTAETRKIRLDDGSEVVMGAQSAVARRFSAQQRGVELLRGEAWFDVAHDSHSPFVISAGDMRVTVTGTAFDVAMTDRTLTVGLARGRVRVDRPGETSIRRDLHPGEQLEIDRRSGAAALSPVAPAAIAAWRDGRLAVENASFADVVAALDRYYHGTILVNGATLKMRKVTGVFDLHDPVRALRALVQPYGGTIRQITPWVVIVTPA
jgi:transmembrane sensor